MKGFKKEWKKISLKPRSNSSFVKQWDLEKVKNNVLPKNDSFAWCGETSFKTPWFYKLKIVHQFSTIKLGLEIKHKYFTNVKLAALNLILRTIKERVKFKGSKQRFHNVVKTEGVRESLKLM